MSRLTTCSDRLSDAPTRQACGSTWRLSTVPPDGPPVDPRAAGRLPHGVSGDRGAVQAHRTVQTPPLRGGSPQPCLPLVPRLDLTGPVVALSRRALGQRPAPRRRCQYHAGRGRGWTGSPTASIPQMRLGLSGRVAKRLMMPANPVGPRPPCRPIRIRNGPARSGLFCLFHQPSDRHRQWRDPRRRSRRSIRLAGDGSVRP